MFLYIDINLKNQCNEDRCKNEDFEKKDKALLNTIINIYKTPVNYKKNGRKVSDQGDELESTSSARCFNLIIPLPKAHYSEGFPL